MTDLPTPYPPTDRRPLPATRVSAVVRANASTVVGHWDTLVPEAQAEAQAEAQRMVADHAARLISGPVLDALHRFLATPGIGTGNPYLIRDAMTRLHDDVTGWHQQLARSATITREPA